MATRARRGAVNASTTTKTDGWMSRGMRSGVARGVDAVPKRARRVGRARMSGERGGAAGDARADVSRDEDGVVVFVNKRSGGRRGREVLKRMRDVMKPPHRVFDASTVERAIERGDVRWNDHTRGLVAGGDGTVALVADALRTHGREPPPMAIAPLGTGNDLARVLGWHTVWDDARLFDQERVVSTLRRARLERVDRWALDIERPKRSKHASTSKSFVNYMGIGVDARAALAFDLARKNNRWTWLFFHELTNKLLYAVFGARDFVEHSFKDLRDDVVVTVDDRVVDWFPEDTEGIILLNINSFSGGVRMWSSASASEASQSGESFQKSRKDDKLLEIVAVTGALHLGQLNVGVAKPVQIAQGSRVRIELKRKLPVQIDGEPWMQRAPATLKISVKDSFQMLARPRRDRMVDLLQRWRSQTSSYDEDESDDKRGGERRRKRRETLRRFLVTTIQLVIFAIACVACVRWFPPSAATRWFSRA